MGLGSIKSFSILKIRMQALTLLFLAALAVAPPAPKPQVGAIVGGAALGVGTAYLIDGDINCAKHSYDRGVGLIPGGNRCHNRVKEAGLCYKPCRDGYHGVATRCYQDGCFSSTKTAKFAHSL